MGTSKATKLAFAALLTVAITLIIGTSITAFSAVNAAKSLPSSGNIKTNTPNVGVFSNSACTINLAAINWGTLKAGGSTTKTVYVKNVGTGTMTLSLASSSWIPATAGTYVTVSWNCQGTQLAAGKSVGATITLTVSAKVTGFTTFTNIITISGTG